MKSITKTEKIMASAYHERKRHYDAMFPFNVYPCTIPHDFAFVSLHWQDSVELIYIKRGSGIIQVDFTSYPATEGDIFLALPGHPHGIRGNDGEQMEYENIIFDPQFLSSDSVDICSQKYLLPLLDRKWNLPTYIGKEHEMYDSISACLNEADRLCTLRQKGFELGVKGQMMILFSLFVQLTGDKKEYPVYDRHMENLKLVLSRIEQDYNKKLTVDGMAAECGYSASHFMRWFQQSTGSGFLAYLIEFRLGKAAKALRSTDDTVLEIAETCGFDNLSYFNRQFKKRFGITPGQFRKHEL